MDRNFPRRAQVERMSSAERTISGAIEEVEAMGADVRLTKAVVALMDARNHVADYVDEQPALPDFSSLTEDQMRRFMP